MKSRICICAVSLAFILSSCAYDNDNRVEQTDVIFDTDAPQTYMATETAETDTDTASGDIQSVLDNAVYPEIIITEDSSPEEILNAGKTAFLYYGEATKKFFGFGVEYAWKMDDEWISIDGIKGIAPELVNYSYREAPGFYTDRENGIYAPMDYEQARQFMISYLRLTERGFDELCSNSPSNYIGINGALCLNSGDGGGAGWSYSSIVDYELGEGTVTYNCQRVGTAEDWGYEEDMVRPFTFRLAHEDGLWKLDGVSYGEGLFEFLLP